MKKPQRLISELISDSLIPKKKIIEEHDFFGNSSKDIYFKIWSRNGFFLSK